MTTLRHPLRPCDGVARREVLRVGGLTAFGLGLTDLFQSRIAVAENGARPPKPAKARSCVLIWLDGGPSHLETFDVKPDAPKEVRGPLKAIATSVAGVHFSECLEQTVLRMSKLAVIRSMTSPLGEHNLGTRYLQTGYRPTPVLDYPHYGAVVAEMRPGKRVLPANIAVPSFRVGGAKFSGNGFLPAPTRPFSVGGDPAKKDFRVRDLDLYPGITVNRIDRRRNFLNALDRLSAGVESSADVPSDPEFEQAYRLITSKDARDAFDLSDERPKVRQRYGNRTIGQSCLLARRLVERGVPFITINHRGWDTHQNLYTRLKEGYTDAKVPVGLIPTLDLGFTALIDDLDQRGLLEETLIVVMGEFGRTPKLNTGGGRDHWPRVFSVVLAGGGVQGGQVIGASDAVGESPRDRPVTPVDLAATIYTLLGIDPNHELHTSDGRPVRVNQGGKVVSEVIAST